MRLISSTIITLIFLLAIFSVRGLAEAQTAAVNADPDFNNYTGNPPGPWIAFKLSSLGFSIWKTPVGGEGWPSGPALWIYGDARAFDGGVYQVVSVTPGRGYHFEVDWAAVRYSGGKVSPDIGKLARQVGMDPFGGTNPLAATVQWSPEHRDASHFQASDLQMDQYAQRDHITIFLRAKNDYTDARAEVFFDHAILTENTGMPPITVAAPTAAPTQTSRPPTATPRSATTRVAQATISSRTQTPTATVTPNPTETETPTPSPFPTRTPRPMATPPEPENSNNPFSPTGIPLIVGALIVCGMGALFLGFVVFRLLAHV